VVKATGLDDGWFVFGGDSLELKAVFSFFLCFPCLRDEKIDRNLGKFPNFFIVLCGRLLIGWKKGSRCLWIFLVNALCLCRLVNTPLCSLLSVPFTGRKCWNLNDSWRFDWRLAGILGLRSWFKALIKMQSHDYSWRIKSHNFSKKI
jgi:hypothetical protein